MHFTNFAVKNYKSFLDWTECHLQKGINLIVGKNSAGKSALLDLLTIAAGDNPHRSPRSMRQKGDVIPEREHQTSFTFSFSKLDLLQEMTKRDFFFPTPQGLVSTSGQVWMTDRLRLWINGIEEEQFSKCTCKGNSPVEVGLPKEYLLLMPEHTEESVEKLWVAWRLRLVPHSHPLAFSFPNHPQGASAATHWFFPAQLLPQLQSQIYRFSAERFKSHTCKVDEEPALRSDATNLPKAISELFNCGPRKSQKFNELVHEVFPEIFGVSTSSSGPPNVKRPGGTMQDLNIYIHTTTPELERDDLKIHLKDCGNGVGQVLAILYLLVSSTEPQIILIDEPTSFLHSTATKKLMKILARYPQHQIIIATHSPLVVNTVKVSTVTRVHYEDGVSALEPLDVPEEYGYQGWTVEQILNDVMQLEDTRSEVYHEAIAKFDQALDDEDLIAAREAASVLKKMLHPRNEMRKLLDIQLTSLAGLEDDQD